MAATTRPGLRSTAVPWQLPVKLVALPSALAVAIIVATSQGPDPIPFSNVVGIVISQFGFPVNHAWPAGQVDIVWNIRLPEVVTASLIGCALAVAGTILQAVLRNPLADPFVIGTSSGAVCGVAFAYALFAGSSGMVTTFVWQGFGLPQVAAFVGALTAVALVFALTYGARNPGPLTFLLGGLAVSTLMVAGMWFIAYQSGHVNLVLGWMMGSLAGSGWDQLVVVGPTILSLSALTLYFVRDLNALLLGEEQASYLGLNSSRTRAILVALAAILTGLAVSLAGIIGFVGLIVPHIARLIYGPNHRILLVASAFMGAVFLVVCDLFARTLEPGGGELPLGILTALVGVPVFLFLLIRSGDSYVF